MLAQPAFPDHDPSVRPAAKSPAGYTGSLRAGLWVPVLLAGLVLAFLWDERLLDDRHFIGGEDVLLSHYWFKSHLQERLGRFELPLWAPQIFAGHPFLAYPEMCVFYPTVALFVLLPVTLAFSLNYAIHLLIAGWGAYLVTARFATSRIAGLTSAVSFTFGGYMADRLSAGHVTYVQSAALLPWTFWALHRAHGTGLGRDRLLAAGIFALLILASPPHNAMYAVVLMLVQTASRVSMASTPCGVSAAGQWIRCACFRWACFFRRFRFSPRLNSRGSRTASPPPSNSRTSCRTHRAI